MKKILIIITCLLLMINGLYAQQTHFTTSGTIEFEKTSNMYAIAARIAESDAFYKALLDPYKKTHAQFKTFKSTLTFKDNKTLFTPDENTDPPQNSFFNTVITEQNNIVFTDVATSTDIIQKQVFDETLLLKDSIRNIKWKITDETREIAGYTCRRANALVLDSIYVVAFYTDKIPVAGGPESFIGLPGMILQVAIPHENIIWRATKVTDANVPDNAILPPKKGKVVTNKSLRATLDGAIKGRGTWTQLFYKAFLL